MSQKLMSIIIQITLIINIYIFFVLLAETLLSVTLYTNYVLTFYTNYKENVPVLHFKLKYMNDFLLLKG